MSNLKRSTFNVLFFIKKTKLLQNGEAPIFVRITVNGKRSEFGIKRSILESLWNSNKECSNGKDRIAKELNHYIQTVKSDLLHVHRQLEIDGEIVTASKIKEKYNKKDECKISFLNYCKQHIESCEKLIPSKYTKTTVDKYGYTFTHLTEFIKSKYKRNDIELFEVTFKFVESFELYLMAEKKLIQNSASRHMQNLKKFVYRAIKDDLIKHNPFRDFKIKYEETDIDYLTSTELKKIVEKTFINRLEKTKDMFIFCCYTGFAYCDASTLTQDNVISTEDGE